jgi:predicted nucleotidyltransferase
MVAAVVSKHDLIERIQAVEPRLRAHGVTRLALFGSFARGDQHAVSDVDLIVEFAPQQKTFDNFLAACELLEASLGRRVELLTVESLSPHIGPRILQEAQDVVVAN